ncbi:MAG: dephospho-CoA kinase [candidate division WOR-3 bacterium]|nr:dephospho-CoA kinase [candidate division WOR-3 bacterium]
MKEKVVIGVGGNIGSGKTTVAKIFSDYGMIYISADKIGWRVLPEIAEELRNHFGDGIFSGEKINRERLRALVFSNRKYLKILNALSHPKLIEKLNGKIDRIRKGMVVVDAALLFDWKELLKKIDYPILVKAPLVLKKKRAIKKGIPGPIFDRILKCQKTEREMAKAAKFVINNNSTIGQLKKQCLRILQEIKNDC